MRRTWVAIPRRSVLRPASVTSRRRALPGRHIRGREDEAALQLDSPATQPAEPLEHVHSRQFYLDTLSALHSLTTLLSTPTGNSTHSVHSVYTHRLSAMHMFTFSPLSTTTGQPNWSLNNRTVVSGIDNWLLSNWTTEQLHFCIVVQLNARWLKLH